MILSRLFSLAPVQALFPYSSFLWRNFHCHSMPIKSLLVPATVCFTSTQNQLLHQRHRQQIEQAKAAYQKRKRRVQERLDRLTENVLTVPNVLTMSRMALTPLLGYFIVEQQHTYAFGLFTVAAITDLLDGFIARNFKHQKSTLGSVLDPLADKLLVSTMFITLTYVQCIPLYLTALVVIRDAILMSAGAFLRYRSLPAPRTFKKYFDPSLATIRIQPTRLSKVNTALQLVMVAGALGCSAFELNSAQSLMNWIGYATAISTITSGLTYAFASNTYKMMTATTLKQRPVRRR